MKKYLLLKFFFCMLFANVLSNRIEHLDDLFFRHATLNNCKDEIIPGENCTGNHHEVHQESGQSNATLHLKLNENVYKIPLYGYESSSVFFPGANVTVEDNTGDWTFSAFEDVPFYEGTDENGTYASGSIINNVFNGFLVPHDRPSIYIESFVVQNDSTSNGSLQLVSYRASDVKIKDCSNNVAYCKGRKFSESIYCNREKRNEITCFSSDVLSESAHLDNASTVPSLPLKLENASCRIQVTVDRTYYALYNNDSIALFSQIVAIFKQLNHVFDSLDLNHNGRTNFFSLRIRNVVIRETDEVSKDAKMDDLTLKNITEDFRNKSQDACISLLLVAIPTERNLLTIAYGGGICKNKIPADNVAVVNMLDSRGFTRPLFANAWIVAMAIGHLLGSSENDCPPTFPYLRGEDWSEFFTACGKSNIAKTLNKEGSCLQYPVDKVEPETINETYWRRALIPMEEIGGEVKLTTEDIKITARNIKPITMKDITTTKEELKNTKGNIKTTKEDTKTTKKFTKHTKKDIKPTKLYIKPTNDSSKLCGNRIIDPGEECDCGSEDHCKKLQSCCVPPGKGKECQYDLSKGYECDWMEPCCTRKCKIVPKSWNKFCGTGDDSCAPKDSYCNGNNSRCPVGRSDFTLKNGQLCGPGSRDQKGAGTCQDGQCVSTLCKDHNKTDCICPVSSGHSCRICCRMHKWKTSKSAIESECVVWEKLGLSNKNKMKEKLYLRHAGTPCDDVRLGHCNKHGKCVQADRMSTSAADKLHVLHHAQIHFLTTTTILIFYLFIERPQNE